MTDDEGLLEEQRRYYQDRAPEYDDLWYRRGVYDLGAEGNARWFEETARLEAALDAFDARGDVLELACGTGLFTRHLVRNTRSVLAVDAVPAVLRINRERVTDPRVTYEQADIFEWSPPAGATFDEIAFSFFISHVPPGRFDAFWANVRSWLKPEGRVFCCDDLPGPVRPELEEAPPEGPHSSFRRRLVDGREYSIVKVFYTPGELTERLSALGWTVEVGTTGERFFHAVARPTG
jgi:demethylmenaquinone methyltransferase/2-methoxy-6-polyprenyl-1,4-benzoquinol methylase